MWLLLLSVLTMSSAGAMLVLYLYVLCTGVQASLIIRRGTGIAYVATCMFGSVPPSSSTLATGMYNTYKHLYESIAWFHQRDPLGSTLKLHYYHHTFNSSFRVPV